MGEVRLLGLVLAGSVLIGSSPALGFVLEGCIPQYCTLLPFSADPAHINRCQYLAMSMFTAEKVPVMFKHLFGDFSYRRAQKCCFNVLLSKR